MLVPQDLANSKYTVSLLAGFQSADAHITMIRSICILEPNIVPRFWYVECRDNLQMENKLMFLLVARFYWNLLVTCAMSGVSWNRNPIVV